MKPRMIIILFSVLAFFALVPRPAGESFHTAPAEAPLSDNLPPLADAGRDFITYVGLLTEFRGYGTAPDDDIAMYQWDFDGDGDYDFQSRRTGVTSYVFNSAGTYMAVLRVTEPQGNVATDTVRVVVRKGTGKQEYLPPTRVTPKPPPLVSPQGDGVVDRYAVMINGGSETRFWNDVTFMYPTLTDDYDFPPERIYLFNHDGTNPEGINPGNMIDYPATLSDIDSVFNDLSTMVDDDDELFVWVTDHGRGYQGPQQPSYGYLDGFASVDPGDEQDYLERDFKLRSLCTYGDYAYPYYNHGMNVFKAYRAYWSSYGAYKMYRNKFVSTFTDVYFEQSGTQSDSDIYIERLVDYLLGDTDRDGFVETDQGEVFDYDGDGNPPYDPGTEAFDEDDWGDLDYYDDNFNNINSGHPGDSYIIFDHNFDNHVDIDINYDPDNLEVDGTDLDNQGLFDGIDVNEDGDMDDWVSIDEKICLYADDMLDDELATFLDRMNANVSSIFMEPCFSGGFIDDLSANNRVISTATEEETPSWGNLFVELFTSALHQATRDGTPVYADYDQNGCVSMMEAFNYAALNDYYDEIPQYDDNGDGTGHPYPIPNGGDGVLGAMTYLAECYVTVNSTADPGDGVCDAAECTLREAINAANATFGTDTIAFNIPGPGPHTIQPTSAIPTITDPVIIDGYTQPGASPNTNPPGLGSNAVLMIELDGSLAGSVDGLRITAGNSTLRGLVINRFEGDAIHLFANGGNRVEGNFIGTDIPGITALGNEQCGVSIDQSPDNIIGGTTDDARNLISGNHINGVLIGSVTSTRNTVAGNFIGTDVTGTIALGNTYGGVSINAGPNNTIGGTTPGAGNLISGNPSHGVLLSDSGNKVEGNFIGTDVTGSAILGNRFAGVSLQLDATDNTIGGTTTGAGNVISGNGTDGVFIVGGSVVENRVVGNFIGTDFTGIAALSNGRDGVRIINDASNNTIGVRNTIAFNGGHGVLVEGSGTFGNTISRNSIHSNSGQGIKLSSGGNTELPAPVITVFDLSAGTLTGTACANCTVEIFSDSSDEGGVYEGQATADGAGDFSFNKGAPFVGPRLTATATDPDGNTSEFASTLCHTVNEIPLAECEALLALYNSTDGDNWTDHSGWLETNTPCSWYGVSCSGGHVVQLGMSANQLSGIIPPQVSDLGNLLHIYLWGNQLTGGIPPELGELSNLRDLSLSFNQLTGAIPPELSELVSLEWLFLNDNQLIGTIPSELGNLGSLHGLFLHSNQLDGSIPPALRNLANLEYLSLGNNQLSNSIPPELGDLTYLLWLTLENNRLSQSIPSELGNLVGLGWLRLHNNALAGEIPTTFTNLVNLSDTDLGYNMLSASDPALIAFLNDKDPDWADTQTVPPTDVQVERVSENSLTLSWTPIAYTGDDGYYQVSYATTSDGPYTVHGITTDKSASGYLAGGLDSGEVYYFVVRSFTPAHGEQQNDLWSSHSQEVSATTPSGALFEDDFSTDQGWVDATAGDFYRDGTGEWLAWHVDRSADQKYYLPINTLSGDFRVEARVRASGWSSDSNLYFGLAESLTGGIFSGPAPTGLFVDVGRDNGYPQPEFMRPLGVYDDQSAYYGDRISYSMDEWYRVVFEVVGSDWTVTVYDEGENMVGQTTGSFPAVHEKFNYIILWNPDDGQSATGDGLLDDLRVFGEFYVDYPLDEEFDSSEGFTQTDPDVTITDGQVEWNVSRSEGTQYVYRDIPAFRGDVRLTVRGQIDAWSEDCHVEAGIGDGPGNGISTDFGFYGSGCPTNGPVVTASGASLDYAETDCTYSGNWLWISPGTPYEAQLNLSGGSATLTVPGVGSSSGTPVYTGIYDTLYVGLTGDGGAGQCSGTIDSIQVEPLLTPLPGPGSNPVYLPLILKNP